MLTEVIVIVVAVMVVCVDRGCVDRGHRNCGGGGGGLC